MTRAARLSFLTAVAFLLSGCHQMGPDDRNYVFRNQWPGVFARVQIDGETRGDLQPAEARSFPLNKGMPHRIDVAYGQLVPVMTPQGPSYMWNPVGADPPFNIRWSDDHGWQNSTWE